MLLLELLFSVIVMIISIVLPVFVIGLAVGFIIKHLSELTGHEAKLYKITRWFFNYLAVVALLGGFVWRQSDFGSLVVFIIPATIFLLFTIIRTLFVKDKEYSILQYITMGINLQIAIVILFNIVENIWN